MINLIDYKDPAKLTLWVTRVAYFGIFASLFSLLAGYWEYEYFQGLTHGLYPTEDLAVAAEEVNDKWVGTAGIFQFSLLFLCIAFFMWVYRINSNTHALGGEEMKFTPGWAVGWFFIPIFNLWKSYQILKELWMTNHLSREIGPDRKKGTKFIWWFWFYFIVNNAFGTAVAKKSLFATELPQLITSNKLSLVSDLMDIPFYMMTIILVERVTKFHLVKFAIRGEEYQKLINELPALGLGEKKWTQSKWVKRSLLSLLTLVISVLVMILLFVWLEPWLKPWLEI